MSWKLISTIIFKSFHLFSLLSVMVIVLILIRVVLWDKISWMFKRKKSKEILEEDPFGLDQVRRYKII